MVVRSGFPRAVTVAMLILCGASAISFLGWLVYFISWPDAAYARLAPGQALWLTAVLSGCTAACSRLLAFQ